MVFAHFNLGEWSRSKLWVACCIAFCGALAPQQSSTAPIILEPTATLTIPDARFSHIADVDIDGDSIIMGVRRIDNTSEYEWLVTDAAFLYRRSASGAWALERKLFEKEWTSHEDNFVPLTVAMDDGLAAINILGAPLYVFERSGAEWVQKPAVGNTHGSNLEVDAGTILGSHDPGCSEGAWAFRPDASGTYVVFQEYVGVLDYCDAERISQHAEISGTTVVIPQPGSYYDPDFVPVTYIWEGFPPAAPTTIPDVGASSIEGDWIATAGRRLNVDGTQFYQRQGPANWVHRQTLEMPDALMPRNSGRAGAPHFIQMEDGFVLQARQDDIEVLQRNSADRYELVARLLGVEYGNVNGRTVVALGDGAVKIFELPTVLSQPDLAQDDFQDLNANDWVPQPGSQFAVVPSSGSHVYRQSSLAGNAISLHSSAESRHQAIQADVKPTAFAAGGSERWFGLIARYKDERNYYYVTARQSNVIQIRRILHGEFTILASAALPVTLNRTYNLRFEAIADRLRLYVDGRLMLEVEDTSFARGHLGLVTYKTAVEYDNVLLNHEPLLPMVVDNFDSRYGPYEGRWSEEGQGSWSYRNDTVTAYEQSSLAGIARSITGVNATTDQIVETRVRPSAFATGGVRWFGLVARYVDPNNYYYVTVRSDNTISLRKLVNGVIHVLDSATLNVSTGTTYRLRLDAVEDKLRVFVNGRHVLEAVDSTFDHGRYGLATYKTSAQFDDFLAVQP